VVPLGFVSKKLNSVMACGGKCPTRYAAPAAVFGSRGGGPAAAARFWNWRPKATRPGGRTPSRPGPPAAEEIPRGVTTKGGTKAPVPPPPVTAGPVVTAIARLAVLRFDAAPFGLADGFRGFDAAAGRLIFRF